MNYLLLLNGIAYGLGAAMPIGPVNVELARRTLRNGMAAGISLGLGAVSVDTCYVVLWGLGVSRFTSHPAVYWPLAIAGVGLLVYLGIQSLRSAFKAGQQADLDSTPAHSLHGSYLTGVLMTATNPMTLAYWFTVLPALAGGITGQPRRDLPIICMGVCLGTLCWVFAFAAVLSVAGRFRKRWWMTASDALGGVMLLALAAVALLRAMYGPL